MIKLTLTLSLLALSACAISQPKKPIDIIQVENAASTCALVMKNVRYESRLMSPCRLAIYKNKHQSVKIKNETVFVLVGKPASSQFISNWNVSEKDKCSDQAQGFKIQNGKIILLPRILKNTLVCPNKYLDEKLIYTLAR